MLLVLDIGNTNIKIGLFEDQKLLHSWRVAVDHKRTADEYGVQLGMFFNHLNLNMKDVRGIITSSVVPSFNYTIEHMYAIYFPDVAPIMVHAGLKTGMTWGYEQPQRLGSDRICNAVAAGNLYGGDCITVDFGTATTFNVQSGSLFLGGMICPGFKVSTTALLEKTAMLPKVEYVKPSRVIGTSTELCLQSGILYGYVGLVEYMVRKARQELGVNAKVIGTGGMGDLIASETDCIDTLNPTLTLQGLAMLYEMNR